MNTLQEISDKEAAERHLAAVVSYLRHCNQAEAEASARRWLALLQDWMPSNWQEPSLTLLDAKGYQGQIAESGQIYGLCPHHMTPYCGSYQLCFQPQQKIVGLSSIGRAVDIFSRRALLQENLTQELGQFFFRLLQPQHLEFRIEARHFCKEMGQANHSGASNLITTWNSHP